MREIFKKIVVSIITWEAKQVLKKHKPIIIGVTGNVGKTSTKDAIYAAIKHSISARKSEKSFNSDIGVPLTVLGLKNGWNNPFLWIKNVCDGFFIAFFSKEYPAVLVLEMGIDRPGDMERLTSWITPSIAVITRLPAVPVHVEYFDTPSQVVTEKMKLVSALQPDGILVYNHDDELIQAQLPQVLQRTIGFSRFVPSDFTGKEQRIVYRDNVPVGTSFTITHNNQAETVTIEGTLGTQHIYACTAATAVADALGIPLTASLAALKELDTPPGRMRLITGIKSSIIIDDTYNSSPTAVEAALTALAEVQFSSRKIAVLGDMLELGRYSIDEHARVGAMVVKAADVLFTVGVRSRKIAEVALASGMLEEHIFQYEDAERAGRELQSFLQSGDIVLVKASQGIRAEKIVEEVMAHPEDAGSLLVRQDVAWSNR